MVRGERLPLLLFRGNVGLMSIRRTDT